MNNKNGSRRVQGILAGVAGAALLLGGGTYALWTASADIEGGKITAGDLNLTAGAYSAYDVSADRDDAKTAVITGSSALMGHTVTLTGKTGATADTDWRIVPGDTLALAFPLEVTLQGDNLVGALTTNAKSVLDTLDFTGPDKSGLLSFQYRLFNGATEVTSGPTAIPADSTVLTRIASNDADKGGGLADGGASLPVVGVNNKATFTYVLLVTFSAGATGTEDATKVADLTTLFAATLDQVRTSGVGQFK